MRKLIVSTYATLDGRVDDLQDWTIPYNTEESAQYHGKLLENSDGLVLGRRTYEAFAHIWPARAGELPYVDKINAMAKHVASTTLTDFGWDNSHPIAGDAAEGVAALKRAEGQDLVVYGGRDLIATLAGQGLVDEWRVLVHPVLFGRGRALLPDGGARTDVELTGCEPMASGVVVLTYRAAPTRTGRIS
ncbi:MAG TPA: dihydrofolate reductase family protein [Dactylosporangium sp.]|jgi:dihydrofolate reductase|nr:dihydrofolate reductase family protein [Dactylosporangium sp.]